jgi:hypothetical protein
MLTIYELDEAKPDPDDGMSAVNITSTGGILK